MKLPDSSYKTGVQSLGREDSRYARGAALAKGDAMSKLLDIPLGMVKEAQKTYKEEENRQGRRKANLHMISLENAYTKQTAGKLDVPGSEVPEWVDPRIPREIEVTGEDGTSVMQEARVPLYHFKADLFRRNMLEGIEKAASYIPDAKIRAEYIDEQVEKITKAYGKLVGQSQIEQRDYGALTATKDQERMEADGRFDDAIDIVDERVDWTEEEKELERTKIYQKKELYNISDVLAAGSVWQIEDEIRRLEQKREARDSVLTQNQALSALSALYGKLSKKKRSQQAETKILQDYLTDQAKGYMDYLYNADDVDLNQGYELKNELIDAGMKDKLVDVQYAEMNAHMFSEIRTTDPNGGRILWDGWVNDAMRMKDKRMLGFLHTKVLPVLEKHEHDFRINPRKTMVRAGILPNIPLDYSNPEHMAEALSKRLDQDGQIEFMSGKPSPGAWGTQEEIREFRRFWDTADQGTQKNMAAAFVSLGREKASKLFNQLHDAGISSSAYNVGVAMLGGRPDLASDLLDGEALLKEKGEYGRIFGQNARAIDAKFRTQVEGFFGPLQQEALNRFVKDGMKIYAMRNQTGIGIDTGTINDITDDLLGKRVKFKGQVIGLPPGVPEKTYKHFLKNFTMDDVAEMGDPDGFSPGQLMNQVKSGVLRIVSYGVGQNVLYDPRKDKVVHNKNGTKFLFKFVDRSMF